MKPQDFPNSVGCQFPIRIPGLQLTDWMRLGEVEIESTALVASNVALRAGAVSVSLDAGKYVAELRGVSFGDVRRLSSLRLRKADSEETKPGESIGVLLTHGLGQIAVFPNEQLNRELDKHDHEDFFEDPLWTCRIRVVEELNGLAIIEAMMGMHADGHVPILELTTNSGHRAGFQLDFIVSGENAAPKQARP